MAGEVLTADDIYRATARIVPPSTSYMEVEEFQAEVRANLLCRLNKKPTLPAAMLRREIAFATSHVLHAYNRRAALVVVDFGQLTDVEVGEQLETGDGIELVPDPSAEDTLARALFIDSLNPTLREVLGWLLQGYAIRDIASKLKMSESTGFRQLKILRNAYAEAYGYDPRGT